MNTKKILEQLNIVETKRTKQHVSTLAEIIKMLSSQKTEIVNFEVKDSELMLGRETEVNRWRDERRVISEGHKVKSQVFIVYTKTGRYSQNIPVNCDLHDQIKQVLGLSIEQKDGFCFSPEALKTIKQAENVCKKAGQENFRYIRLTSEAGKLLVRSTDGARLINKYVNFGGPEFDIFLHASKVTYLKPDTQISIQPKGYSLGGLFIEHPEVNFPDFSQVWPAYTDFVEVNRNELIEAVKQARIAANSVTKQMQMYFKGQISIKAEDEYFGKYKEIAINYKRKTLQDFELCLNADFVLQALEVNQDKKKG